MLTTPMVNPIVHSNNLSTQLLSCYLLHVACVVCQTLTDFVAVSVVLKTCAAHANTVSVGDLLLQLVAYCLNATFI